MENTNFNRNGFVKFWLAVMGFIKRLIFGIGNFFKNLPFTIWKGIKAVGRGFKNYGLAFWKGDVWTKSSFVVMGMGCLGRKQIVKGLMYLALQAMYVLYMVFFGWQYLSKFGTLGDTGPGEVWDEENQIWRVVEGDNSMLILLFSVFTIIITVAILIFYIMNVKEAYRNQLALKEGKKLNNFKQDLKDLANRKYYITLMTLPCLGIICFTFMPLLFMVFMAFTNFDRFHQPPGNLFTWVGLENFKNLLGGDAALGNTFFKVLGWTLIWAICATFLNYFMGMILAIMINKKGIRAKKLWRTVFVLTIAVPQFVSLMLMRNFFHELGPMNVMLQSWGWISKPIDFWGKANIARFMIILVNLWVGIPYTMLITTGILMNIPEELYESARIDGAGPVRQFFSVTMPYMLFVTTPYLITQFTGNLNNFNVIYLLSGGAPQTTEYALGAGKTDLLVTWLYKLTVNTNDYNIASTIGIIVFIITGIFSLISFNTSNSVKKEETFQ